MNTGQGKDSKAVDLFSIYTNFRNKFIIPETKYEEIFKDCLNFTNNKYIDSQCEEFKRNKLMLDFYHDINDSAEAWAQYKGDFTSDIKCNKARPITIEKCQQLASHEGTHHYNFCLFDEVTKNLPEFQVQLSSSPISFIMEGAAEVGVDLIFEKALREKHLREKLIPMLNNIELRADEAAQRLMTIDYLTTELWRSHTLIAKDFVNKVDDKEKCIKRMREESLKPNNSWPNCDFYEKYKSYMISYGWGKYIIMQYLLLQKGNIWDNYLNFLRKPPTPNTIIETLKKQNIL